MPLQTVPYSADEYKPERLISASQPLKCDIPAEVQVQTGETWQVDGVRLQERLAGCIALLAAGGAEGPAFARVLSPEKPVRGSAPSPLFAAS